MNPFNFATWVSGDRETMIEAFAKLKAIGWSGLRETYMLERMGVKPAELATFDTGVVTCDVVTADGRVVKAGYDNGSLIAFGKIRERLTYEPGGVALPPYERVYSTGKTVNDAIESLAAELSWGDISDIESEYDADALFWYARFSADGTGMKASGRSVPGGVILSWWK